MFLYLNDILNYFDILKSKFFTKLYGHDKNQFLFMWMVLINKWYAFNRNLAVYDIERFSWFNFCISLLVFYLLFTLNIKTTVNKIPKHCQKFTNYESTENEVKQIREWILNPFESCNFSKLHCFLVQRQLRAKHWSLFLQIYKR